MLEKVIAALVYFEWYTYLNYQYLKVKNTEIYLRPSVH